jgi:outer membrane autotransporter protein
MPHHRARPDWKCLLLAFGLVAGFASGAEAQLEQGTIFNQIFNVGGVGVRNDFSQAGATGSVGCGSAIGSGLTDTLNQALNQNVPVGSEDNLPIGQRRELWRFCDAMTDWGGAWTVQNITPGAERGQNTGFAPADRFGQADVAKSMANWQLGSVAARMQQIRAARLDRQDDSSYALARGEGELRMPAITPAAPGPAQTPQSFAERDDQRQRVSDAAFADLLREGLNAGDDALGVDGLGLFLTGRYVRLNQDTTLNELGSTTNGGGFTLGADYRLLPSLVLGGAFGFNHYATDFSANAGSSDINDYAFMVFGSFFINDTFYVDGQLRGSYLTTDTTKLTPTLDGGPTFLPQTSDPDGWTISGDVAAGAELPWKSLLVNPYVRLGVYHSSIDEFSERGGDGSLSLRVNDQSVTSLPLTLGTSIVYNFSTSAGVISPYVRGQYLHEFLDQAAIVSGFLQVIPTAQFSIRPNAVDRNYGTVGVGASMTFAKGWAGFVDYDALVGYFALTTHTATIGIRKEL